ncbi:hypothetical protein B0H21DRAFT_893489 [Amylocystis lapponica]|nr:hypothetical protein B0H21DRAFT_893489 [Amylocystis lapponica]
MAQAPQQLPNGFISNGVILPPNYHQPLQSGGISGSETVLLRNIDELLYFKQLIAVEPQTRAHVKELHIHGWGNLTGYDQRLWIDSIPRYLGGQLFNLKIIHFESWNESYLNTQCIRSLADAFPTIDTLRFSHCKFTHFQDFEEALFSFPALSHLCIYNLNGFPYDDPNATLTYLALPNPRRRDMRLKSLHLAWDCNIWLMFAWLRLTAPSLQRLQVEAVNTEDDIRAVTALLQTLGPELQHLTIGCVFNADMLMRTRFEDFIDISHNTGLVSLRLYVESLETYNLHWVSTILVQLASRRITEVALDLPLSHENDLMNTTWNWIVARLGELNLRKVEVVHCGPLGWREAEAAIRAQFSWLPFLNVVNERIDCSS